MAISNTCPAAALATEDPETIAVETSVEEAVEWLEEKDYDVAPVLEESVPIGYVAREDLAQTGIDQEDSVGDYVAEITVEMMISPQASFEEVLEALSDQGHYFLGGHNDINGVLTRADLNSQPARNHLFTAVLELERQLRELVEEETSDWREWASFLDTDRQVEIETDYNEAKRANVELEHIHHVTFGELKEAVVRCEECREVCADATDGTVGSGLGEIVALRNDIAHAKPIIQNTDVDADQDGDGRTIADLRSLYDNIKSYQDTL